MTRRPLSSSHLFVAFGSSIGWLGLAHESTHTDGAHKVEIP